MPGRLHQVGQLWFRAHLRALCLSTSLPPHRQVFAACVLSWAAIQSKQPAFARLQLGDPASYCLARALIGSGRQGLRERLAKQVWLM